MDPNSLLNQGRKIVCMVNQKGGVGKTTSVLSLASGLALAGQKVLLIDGDPQGNLSLFFDEKRSPDLSDLLIELIRSTDVESIDRFKITGVRDNLDLVPLYNRKFRSDISENQLFDVAYMFSEIVKNESQKYDWIFIDSSPSNGMLEKLLISSSKSVLVPLEYQLFSISGLKSMLVDVQTIGKRLGKRVIVDALLFTKIEERLTRTKEYRKLFSDFSIPIFEVFKSEAMARSIEDRKTIWEYNQKSSVCLDYLNIIEKLFFGVYHEKEIGEDGGYTETKGRYYSCDKPGNI